MKVTLGSKTERTKTINDDLNPRWNATPMLFSVTDPGQVLKLEVFDEDPGVNIIKGDDSLGHLQVPIAHLMQLGAREPVNLRENLCDVAHGSLEVELAFVRD